MLGAIILRHLSIFINPSLMSVIREYTYSSMSEELVPKSPRDENRSLHTSLGQHLDNFTLEPPRRNDLVVLCYSRLAYRYFRTLNLTVPYYTRELSSPKVVPSL